MDTQGTGSDTTGSLVERVRDRITAADRGWKATVLGVGIALAFAVGPP